MPPRRRFRSRSRGARPRLVWDTIEVVQADLPLLLLDETQALDGAFSSVKRYDGTDLTVKRTIFDCVGRVTALGNQPNQNMVLEICIGLSWFDSMQDASGLAIASTIAAGTGPLDDADNNRWYARCCLDIPIGSIMARFDAAEGSSMVVPINGKFAAMGSWWIISSATPAGIEMGFHCHWDSKSGRRVHGIETPFLQAAFQAGVSSTPAAGDDISIAINKFSGRHDLALRA